MLEAINRNCFENQDKNNWMNLLEELSKLLLRLTAESYFFYYVRWSSTSSILSELLIK